MSTENDTKTEPNGAVNVDTLDDEISRTYGAIWAPGNLEEILSRHGWSKTADTRQQVAEEIAKRADQIAENYQATAVAHRDLSDRTTAKGMTHRRTASAFRNKADGAWAVAHAIREIGGQA